MKTTFRSILLNILIALAIAFFPLTALIASMAKPHDQDAPVALWSLAIITVIVVVRALRRGVFVEESLLVERRLFLTQLIPWRSATAPHSASRGRCVFLSVGKVRVRVNAQPRYTNASFEPAITAAWTEANLTPRRVDHAYPRLDRRWITYALLVSVALAWTGVTVLEDAKHDEDVYRTRALRDLETTAVVTESHIDEDDSGEGDTEYTTYVGIRFYVDGRPVETELHRPDQWTYKKERVIGIVYDSKNPRDADFASRLNRRANDSSVELRLDVGPLLAIVGALGSAVFGAMVLTGAAETRRRARRLDSLRDEFQSTEAIAQ